MKGKTMKLIKITRTYVKDSIEHKATDLYIVKENGWRIQIAPKWQNKRDFFDLLDMAEEVSADPKAKYDVVDDDIPQL